MTIPAIFETSRPRDDVLRGAIAEADFAADLAQVVAGRGGAEYLDPARFFARTYPTRGLRDLLANVGRRLTGAGGEAAAIFRLDTSYGGGCPASRAAPPTCRRRRKPRSDPMTRVKRMALIETPESAPRYELRVRGHRPGDTEYEIWQMPSAATPQITVATRIAGLRGRNLELVEHRVLKRLGSAGIKLGPSRRRERHGYALTEDLALTLGLWFRVLAPMRNRDNMRAVAEGIEAMGRKEAAYWLGMAMHRRHPRRVLDGAAVPVDGAEAAGGPSKRVTDTRPIERWLPVPALGETSD